MKKLGYNKNTRLDTGILKILFKKLKKMQSGDNY